MNRSKIKWLLGICLIIACGLLWIFWEKKDPQGAGENSFFEDNSLSEQSEIVSEEAAKKIYVHIVGEIKNPGVYTFEKNPRVIEVVDAAGGFTSQAARSGVNQAEIVEDGVQITIESKKSLKKKRAKEDKDGSSETIDINTATKEELMTLPGIGESKALAILTYRETEGRFQTIEDIMKITGIKNGVFDKIKAFIRV